MTKYEVPRAVQTLPARQCGGCRQELHGRNGKKYCNATCRARAHRRREKEQVLKIARDIKDAVHELEQLVGRE